MLPLTKRTLASPRQAFMPPGCADWFRPTSHNFRVGAVWSFAQGVAMPEPYVCSGCLTLTTVGGAPFRACEHIAGQNCGKVKWEGSAPRFGPPADAQIAYPCTAGA